MGKPVVSDAMKNQAERMIPIPANCQPWLAAQRAGLVVVWPHETTTLTFGPTIQNMEIGTGMEYAETVETPFMEWNTGELGNYVGRFAPWHFSLLPLYLFQTPPGIGLYVVGLPDDYKSPIEQRLVVRGVLETDWFSSPPFFVFKIPYVYGETTIVINKGDPLCMVVPVLLDPIAEEMTGDEVSQRMDASGQYNVERTERDDLLWYSQSAGMMFSHLYKERSRNFRADRP